MTITPDELFQGLLANLKEANLGPTPVNEFELTAQPRTDPEPETEPDAIAAGKCPKCGLNLTQPDVGEEPVCPECGPVLEARVTTAHPTVFMVYVITKDEGEANSLLDLLSSPEHSRELRTAGVEDYQTGQGTTSIVIHANSEQQARQKVQQLLQKAGLTEAKITEAEPEGLEDVPAPSEDMPKDEPVAAEPPKEEQPVEPEEKIKKVSRPDAEDILKKLGAEDVDIDEFVIGINVELEHGETVGWDLFTIGKIALDHIREFAKYYSKGLKPMEKQLKKEEPEKKPIKDDAAGYESRVSEHYNPPMDWRLEEIKVFDEGSQSDPFTAAEILRAMTDDEIVGTLQEPLHDLLQNNRIGAKAEESRHVTERWEEVGSFGSELEAGKASEKYGKTHDVQINKIGNDWKLFVNKKAVTEEKASTAEIKDEDGVKVKPEVDSGTYISRKDLEKMYPSEYEKAALAAAEQAKKDLAKVELHTEKLPSTLPSGQEGTTESKVTESEDMTEATSWQKQVHDVLQTQLHPDIITHKRDGSLLVKRSYFYRQGSAESYAQRVEQTLEAAKVPFGKVDFNDQWAAWPKSSYFVVAIEPPGGPSHSPSSPPPAEVPTDADKATPTQMPSPEMESKEDDAVLAESTNALKGVAKATGTSVAHAEKNWKAVKASYMKQHKKSVADLTDKDYARITGIVKKSLKQTKEGREPNPTASEEEIRKALEEGEYTVIARGLDVDAAGKMSKEKAGSVVSPDDEDPKKFMVVMKESIDEAFFLKIYVPRSTTPQEFREKVLGPGLKVDDPSLVKIVHEERLTEEVEALGLMASPADMAFDGAPFVAKGEEVEVSVDRGGESGPVFVYVARKDGKQVHIRFENEAKAKESGWLTEAKQDSSFEFVIQPDGEKFEVVMRTKGMTSGGQVLKGGMTRPEADAFAKEHSDKEPTRFAEWMKAHGRTEESVMTEGWAEEMLKSVEKELETEKEPTAVRILKAHAEGLKHEIERQKKSGKNESKTNEDATVKVAAPKWVPPENQALWNQVVQHAADAGTLMKAGRIDYGGLVAHYKNKAKAEGKTPSVAQTSTSKEPPAKDSSV